MMQAGSSTDPQPYAAARQALARSLRGDITDERVLAAFARVPRERFVPEDLRPIAYEDHPLRIGFGQTISQPRMVGLMLQELHLQGPEKVLELGTGSGYQTALLAELANEVVSVELIPQLADSARAVLQELGYSRVALHVAGEELGWPDAAPFDAIVVSAAAPRVPQSLIDQLAEEGRLAIPVGSKNEQDLLVVQRRPEGLTVKRKGPCRFVPLIGDEAYVESEIRQPEA